MPPDPIRYRPHHFLCTLGFAGKGYAPEFTANMARIVEGRLRAPGGDATPIEVVGAADDICTPCPKRCGRRCAAQDRVAALDARHARALGLRVGTWLTWGAAKRRMIDRVPPGSLARLCAGCQWLELGLCEAALAGLHGKS